MNRSRWTIVALALTSAVAFAVSVQVGRWWSIDDCSIGPFGSRDCIAGMSSGLAWIGGSQSWMRTGVATWAGGMIAMLALIVVAASTAAGRLSRLAARTSLVAIVSASIAAVAFAIGFPGLPGAQLDRGIALFVAGDVLGVIAAILVLRAAKR
jgi:hypothetical protein